MHIKPQRDIKFLVLVKQAFFAFWGFPIRKVTQLLYIYTPTSTQFFQRAHLSLGYGFLFVLNLLAVYSYSLPQWAPWSREALLNNAVLDTV